MQKSRRQFIVSSVAQGLGFGLTCITPPSFAQTNPKPMNSIFKDTEIRDPSTGRVIGIRIRLPEKKTKFRIDSLFTRARKWFFKWSTLV